MDVEKIIEELENRPLIIDEKPWLSIILYELLVENREPLILSKGIYKSGIKILYELEKHVRNREARVALLLQILLALLLS